MISSWRSPLSSSLIAVKLLRHRPALFQPVDPDRPVPSFKPDTLGCWISITVEEHGTVSRPSRLRTKRVTFVRSFSFAAVDVGRVLDDDQRRPDQLHSLFQAQQRHSRLHDATDAADRSQHRVAMIADEMQPTAEVRK